MDKQSRIDHIRQVIAGWLFALAGRVHQSYDVWLDDAPPRHPRAATRPAALASSPAPAWLDVLERAIRGLWNEPPLPTADDVIALLRAATRPAGDAG
jgi:hypothetical protein